MADRYSNDDVVADLKRALETISLRSLAREMGLSATFISMVARGGSPPGRNVAEHFGYHEDGLRWVRRRKRSA